jgi:hypothetical protein
MPQLLRRATTIANRKGCRGEKSGALSFIITQVGYTSMIS